jgi:hypothetical protein
MPTLTTQDLDSATLTADGAIVSTSHNGADSGSGSSRGGRSGSSSSSSSGSDDGCGKNIGPGDGGDNGPEKSNDMTPAQAEIKQKRQALMKDDDIYAAAAPSRSRLPAAARRAQPRRRGRDGASEPGGRIRDETDAPDAPDLGENSTILEAAASGPRSKAVAGPPKSSSSSRTKRSQTTSLLDRPPPNNRSRTGRLKPKASDDEKPEFWENYQGLYKVCASETPPKEDANERGESPVATTLALGVALR